MKPVEAWLVREPKGRRSVFIERGVAERYAVLVRGTWHPLVEAERASDLVQQPEMPNERSAPALPDPQPPRPAP